jgi:hypothetical protein
MSKYAVFGRVLFLEGRHRILEDNGTLKVVRAEPLADDMN